MINDCPVLKNLYKDKGIEVPILTDDSVDDFVHDVVLFQLVDVMLHSGLKKILYMTDSTLFLGGQFKISTLNIFWVL